MYCVRLGSNHASGDMCVCIHHGVQAYTQLVGLNAQVRGGKRLVSMFIDCLFLITVHKAIHISMPSSLVKMSVKLLQPSQSPSLVCSR